MEYIIIGILILLVVLVTISLFKNINEYKSQLDMPLKLNF
mgnify:CR=1 FL=1